MYKLLTVFILMSCLSCTLAYYNYNNINKPQGTTGKLLSLLGEDDSDESDEQAGYNNNKNNYGNSDIVGNYFRAPMELLELAETLIRLKGEIVEKVIAVFYENRDLVHDVAKFFITHASSINRSLLGFIRMLRKIVEFGADTFSSWNPSQSQSRYNYYRPTNSYYTRSAPHPVASSVNYGNQVERKSISEAIADIMNYGNHNGTK